MTSGDLFTVAGMLAGQLVLMAALVWTVTKLLLGRIDRVEERTGSRLDRLEGHFDAVETRLVDKIDDLAKEVTTGRLEIVGDLKHLTGRMDEFLQSQRPEPRASNG